jgi:hypothetical protein
MRRMRIGGWGVTGMFVGRRGVRHFQMHRVEGERFQPDGVADGSVAQVEQHVDALRRREKGPLAARG